MSSQDPERITVKALPKTKAEEILEDSFYKALAAQSERLDKFALELIKLQLAIPALYAGLIKLMAGEPVVATAPDLVILLLIFVPWLMALALSFWAVFPAQQYAVKASPIIEVPLPAKPPATMAMNAYFHFSTQRKFWLLLASCSLSFFGIALAVFSTVI